MAPKASKERTRKSHKTDKTQASVFAIQVLIGIQQTDHSMLSQLLAIAVYLEVFAHYELCLHVRTLPGRKVQKICSGPNFPTFSFKALPFCSSHNHISLLIHKIEYDGAIRNEGLRRFDASVLSSLCDRACQPFHRRM